MSTATLDTTVITNQPPTVPEPERKPIDRWTYFSTINQNRNLLLQTLRYMPEERHSKHSYFESPVGSISLGQATAGMSVCVNGAVMLMGGVTDISRENIGDFVSRALGISYEAFMAIDSKNFTRSAERMADVCEGIFEISPLNRFDDTYVTPPVLQPLVLP